MCSLDVWKQGCAKFKVPSPSGLNCHLECQSASLSVKNQSVKTVKTKSIESLLQKELYNIKYTENQAIVFYRGRTKKLTKIYYGTEEIDYVKTYILVWAQCSRVREFTNKPQKIQYKRKIVKVKHILVACKSRAYVTIIKMF